MKQSKFKKSHRKKHKGVLRILDVVFDIVDAIIWIFWI